MAVTPEGNETNATPMDQNAGQNPGQGHAGQSPFAVASDNLAELLARAIVVGHPDVGGEDTYVIEPGQPLKFTFSLDDVQIIQADGDIILAFDDGGQVTFTTMVAAAFSDNPPVLLMPDGQALSAEVLLDKAMDISQLAEGLAGLETASGPASGAPATNYAETLGGFGEGGFGDVPPLPPVNVVSSLGTVPPLRGFNDGGDSGSGGNNGGGDNGGLGPLPPLPAVIAGDDSGSVTEDNVLKVGGNLTVTDQNAGEAVFDGVSEPGKYGLLTITEDGTWEYSLNNDATAIQQLPEGQTLTDTVTVQSADGTTHEITITITGTNDVPVITGDVAGGVAEDTTLTTSGTLTGDDVDLNEDGFQPQTDTAGDYGNFSIDADGNWTYDLTANDDPAIQGLGVGDSLTESFTVISKDGTATETVTVTIEGTNDAPVVAPVNEDNVDDGTAVFSVAEDNSLIITSADLLANSSDVDGDDLSVVNLQADNGTLVDNGDGTWTFTPGENFNGKVNLTFGVNDGHVTTDATGTIRVTPVADAAEISGADTGGTVEDTTLTASGSLAVVDPDAGEAAFQVQTGTAGDHGSFSIDADGNWTYDLTGNDSDIVQGLGEGETLTEVFTVRSLDGTEHDVTVTIEGTNDAPVVSGPIADNMDEDGGSITFTSDDLLANVSDVDVNDTHTVSNVQVDGGAIVDNGDGTWTFTPDENFNGEVNLTYDVSDGTATVPASGTITVDAVADTAVITGDDAGAVTEDTTLTATGSLAVADPDAGEAVFNTDPVNGTYGSLTITEGGDWEYSLNNDATAIQQLPEGQTLTDTVTVTSADGTTHDVTITITGTNDVPQITGDAAGLVAEDASTLTTSGTLTTADTDTGESFVQPQTDTAGDYGNFSIDADGNWTYDLTANDDPTIQGLGVGDSLTETFTVTSQDGTATETVTVTIEGTNDAPVVAPVNADNEDDGTAVFSMAEDHTLTITSADLLANSSDVDGDDLSVVNLQADNGTIVDNGDGTWSFTPGENFNGKVNLTFGVNDGHVTTDANGTIRVTPVADMPTVTTAEASGVEDHAVDLNVGAELTDGSETLSVTISGVPDGATITGGSDLGGGVWSVDPGQLDSLKLNPPTDFSGEIEMTLHATSTESNGDSKTATDSFKVYVAPDADALSLNVADVTADTGPAMGTDASEVITGTQGADALYGGGGDDVIVSYGGGDYVVGDESGVGGNFTADLSIAADGGDSDGSEVLTVTIDGLPDGASLSAGTQQPDGSWHLSTADLAGLSVSGPAGAGDFDLTVTLTTVDSESDRGGTDTDSVSKTIHVSVEGGAGETGVAGADNITTGAGDDTVYGDYTTVSQDASEGGRGDVISTGAGDDFVVGGLGADNISTGADDDIVYGDRYGTDWTGAQAAHESSKDGGDNINTGSGDDTVYAMGGDDNVTAGDGSDTVHGGDGNDMIVGDTTAVASPEPAAITSITANVAMSGRGTAGTFRVFVNGEYAGTYQTDVKKTHDGDSDAISIDGLHLQPGTEPTITIIPVADKSQIWVDSIEVGGKVYEAETDATYTHAKEMGDYVKLQHGGSITFTVGDDAFTSAGGAGGQDAVANDDQLYGGSGNDVIFGDTGDLGETTGGNDRVDGGAGDDRLYGEGGNDTVVGGTGRDWISGGADNGHVTVSATEITLHFQSSDAGYDNSFGYFIMDEDGNPTIGQVLWTDVNDGGSETIDLNGIDPANIGYFIIPDGDNQNSGFWDGAEVTFHQNGDGEWTAYLNGQPLDGQGAPAYFSGDGSLNPDGMVHVNIGDDGQISFEDLYGGGDSDFNDVVMGSETTQEVTDSANGDHLWGGEEGGHEVSVSDQLLETGEVASDHDATGADQAYLSSHGVLSDGGVEAGQVLSIWNAGDEENSSYRISWGDGDYRYVTVEAGKETYVLMDGHDAGMAYTLEAADGNGGWEDVSTVVSGSDYDSSLNSTMVNVMGDGEQDVFFFKEGDGFDTIHDFEVGVDQLVISGYDADDMSFHTDGNDTVITLGDQGDGLRLIGVDASDITGDDNVAHYDADTNHDGSLSVDEVVDMREQIFDDGGQSNAPDAHDTSIVFVAPVEPGLNPENNGEDPPQS